MVDLQLCSAVCPQLLFPATETLGNRLWTQKVRSSFAFSVSAYFSLLLSRLQKNGNFEVDNQTPVLSHNQWSTKERVTRFPVSISSQRSSRRPSISSPPLYVMIYRVSNSSSHIITQNTLHVSLWSCDLITISNALQMYLCKPRSTRGNEYISIYHINADQAGYLFWHFNNSFSYFLSSSLYSLVP